MDDLIATPRYKGVRGWLLFLCISLTILRPLMAMAKHGANGEDIYHPNVPMVFDLAVAACSVYVSICLWCVRPRAVMKARVFLWALAALNAMLVVLILFSPGDYPAGQSQSFLTCMGVVLGPPRGWLTSKAPNGSKPHTTCNPRLPHSSRAVCAMNGMRLIQFDD